MTPVRDCSREPDLKVVRGLRLRRSCCSLLKNWDRLVDFRDAEKDERRIRSRLQAAICVVDIDVGLSQARCYPRDLAGSVRKLGLNEFCFNYAYCGLEPGTDRKSTRLNSSHQI